MIGSIILSAYGWALLIIFAFTANGRKWKDIPNDSKTIIVISLLGFAISFAITKLYHFELWSDR